MWDERQRTQKIGIELERVKRALREQDQELEELTAAQLVGEAELAAAGRRLDEARREGAPKAAPTGCFGVGFARVVVRG